MWDWKVENNRPCRVLGHLAHDGFVKSFGLCGGADQNSGLREFGDFGNEMLPLPSLLHSATRSTVAHLFLNGSRSLRFECTNLGYLLRRWLHALVIHCAFTIMAVMSWVTMPLAPNPRRIHDALIFHRRSGDVTAAIAAERDGAGALDVVVKAAQPVAITIEQARCIVFGKIFPLQ